MAARPFVYRFRNDLRLEDHAGLNEAAGHGPIVPLLVLDDTLSARLRRSPRRAQFYCEAVAALDRQLREYGSRLIIRRGVLEKEVLETIEEFDALGVGWSAAYDRAEMLSDRSLQAAVEQRGRVARLIHDSPAVPPEELTAARGDDSRGYRAFAPYFQVWIARQIRSYESPLLLRFAQFQVDGERLPQAREFGPMDADGAGSLKPHDDLDDFLDVRAARYGTHAKIPSANGTSRLGAHLSFGTLSARSVVRSVAARVTNPLAIGEQRLSFRLYLRSLARRDFFAQLSWFNPQTDDEPLQAKMRGFPWKHSHSALDAWRQGATGFPLVDAGIRQLHQSGWMHPHVRAVAGSLLCFDLGVDWRIGRDEWDRWLTEDDRAAATGNWQWIAGVGADMAQFPRIYNPERQRHRFDPEAIYVRRWIEELRHVPVDAWCDPTESSQLAFSLFTDEPYPAPIVDHAAAARTFLRRYREFLRR